jgi:hypothetical protein
MAESGDAGVAAAVVALSRTLRPVDEFNAVTAGVLEGNEAFDVTRRRLAFGVAADGIPSRSSSDAAMSKSSLSRTSKATA